MVMVNNSTTFKIHVNKLHILLCKYYVINWLVKLKKLLSLIKNGLEFSEILTGGKSHFLIKTDS